MKTLLFTIEYPPFKGGVAKYYETTVKYWPKNDKIYVLNNNKNELISKKIFPNWLPAFYHLFKTIKKYGIDYVLVGHVLPLGTVTLILSKILRFDYSVFIHGMDIEYAQKEARKKKLARLILNNAKYIICNSKNTKYLVKEFLGGNKKKNIRTVYPGISPQAPYDQKEIDSLKEKYNPDNKFMLLTIARLVKRKGQDMVIDALNSEENKKNDIIYLIGGTGPDEDYLKEKAKNNKNIIFLGPVEENTKWSLLRACDVFIMPAREIDGDIEGFGISYLEAGIVKKPIIAGWSGGAKEAIIDYETGIFCDPESVEDVFETIQKIKVNWSFRHHLGENAMRRVGDKFGAEKQARKIYTLIN